MIGYTGIIDDLIDHVNLLQELGARSVELDPSVLPLSAPDSPRAPSRDTRPATVEKTRLAPPAGSRIPAAATPKARGKAKPALSCAEAVSDICARVAECTACPLHQSRTRTVPGKGNINAPDIMFIGEAPGADEDAQGEPFVGAAGQFLTKMIIAMGYRREDVFIANICKCRPPNNRTPHTEEMQKCLPFLQEQIRAVRPKVLFLLGNTAIKGVLGGSGMRGQWDRFNNIPVMSTYHPSYIIRFERGNDDSGMKRAKTEVWRACRLVLAQLGKPVPAVTSRPAAEKR